MGVKTRRRKGAGARRRRAAGKTEGIIERKRNATDNDGPLYCTYLHVTRDMLPPSSLLYRIGLL